MRCLIALGALSLPMIPQAAEACGGLFCGTTPVFQSEEAIIFDVDVPGNRVTAMINIVYQGSADEFVWLLPLQVAPERIDIASTYAFSRLSRLTQPTFVLQSDEFGECNRFPRRNGEVLDAGASAPDAAAGGAVVLQRGNVGAYDTVVLTGDTPDAIETWLTDNGFRVTSEMMDLVVPYLTKGDKLLALKLLNDRDIGEIRPIEIEMTADIASKQIEACIPIRMTAMAANTDMPITTYVFSDQGRAIPQNFFHVIPNLARIDWISGGANYRQVIAEAADEADQGHAFVTEYAGDPATLLAGRIYDASFDEANLRDQTDLADFLTALSSANLLRRPGMQEIITSAFDSVAACPNCPIFDFQGERIDANPVVDTIVAEIIEPDRRAQALVDRRKHFTRLLTMLDPEEMSVDPIFAYDPDLPDVSNIHRATLRMACGEDGEVIEQEVALDGGRVIELDLDGRPDPVVFGLPAAEKIEQLFEGTLVRDNSAEIDAALALGPDAEPRPFPTGRTPTGIRSPESCSCNALEARGGLFGLGLLMVFVALRVKGSQNKA